MNGKWFAMIAVLFVYVMSSCGTSKKLEAAESQIADLNNQNAKLSTNVHELNADAANLADQNKAMANNFAQYRQQCERVQAKYKDARAVLNEQQAMLTHIEEKLQAALTDLEGRGLSVHHKKGLLYVSMEDQLLYKSGSSKLNQSGIDALSKIAGVMNDYPDVKVIVVGHTDDAMFKNGNDNWSLSTERANGVVRVLRDVYKTDPARLTAAGKGKFDPVADNATAEGKAKNRRTDIIFNPDLDKVWDDMDSEH